MNYKLLGRILGKIMILEGALMLAPFLVSLIYREGARNVLAFLIPLVALAAVGALLQLPKPRRTALYQKEGFALVALVWIVMTLFAANLLLCAILSTISSVTNMIFLKF